MSQRYQRNRDRGQAVWQQKPEKPVVIITPHLRAALADLLETDPARFIAACVEARVASLSQIQAWRELLVADPWRALEIAVLAEDAGIEHSVQAPKP